MKILIICRLDGISNEKRALEIKKYLEHKKHSVELLNVLSTNFLKYALWTEKINYQTKLWLYQKKLSYYPVFNEIIFKARYWNNLLKRKDFDALICQSCADDLFFLETDFKNRKCLKILDVATPWAAELKFAREFPEWYTNKIQDLERKVYLSSDYVSLMWGRYLGFVKKNVTKKANYVVVNWGCDKTKIKAKFSKKPRIVILGSLGWYWNNLPLLVHLQKISPLPIDIYGGKPAPPKKYNLNYFGFAPSTDILAKYQFGLVTVSKDELRRSAFSSRQMTYISYGLPVLMPDWYAEPLLNRVGISYNEQNFVSQLMKYSDKKLWNLKHKNCLEFADKFYWQKTLTPLDKIFNDYEKKKTDGIYK